MSRETVLQGALVLHGRDVRPAIDDAHDVVVIAVGPGCGAGGRNTT